MQVVRVLDTSTRNDQLRTRFLILPERTSTIYDCYPMIRRNLRLKPSMLPGMDLENLSRNTRPHRDGSRIQVRVVYESLPYSLSGRTARRSVLGADTCEAFKSVGIAGGFFFPCRPNYCERTRRTLEIPILVIAKQTFLYTVWGLSRDACSAPDRAQR